MALVPSGGVNLGNYAAENQQEDPARYIPVSPKTSLTIRSDQHVRRRRSCQPSTEERWTCASLAQRDGNTGSWAVIGLGVAAGALLWKRLLSRNSGDSKNR